MKFSRYKFLMRTSDLVNISSNYTLRTWPLTLRARYYCSKIIKPGRNANTVAVNLISDALWFVALVFTALWLVAVVKARFSLAQKFNSWNKIYSSTLHCLPSSRDQENFESVVYAPYARDKPWNFKLNPVPDAEESIHFDFIAGPGFCCQAARA